MKSKVFVLAATLTVLLAFGPRPAFAHCDTLDGPVVTEARAALLKGDVAPVLKWVKKENEEEIRGAFRKTLAVRAKGEDSRELADQWFFETLVRVHRAGEGEPFTGLKPAGTDPGPAVRDADKALESGSVDALAKEAADRAAAGVRERFERAREARAHAARTVEAGRGYAKEYVRFVHYVDNLFKAAAGHGDHPAEAGEAHHGHASSK